MAAQRLIGEAACPTNLASDVEIAIKPAGRPTVRLVGNFRGSWPDQIRLQLRFGPFTPVASIAVRADSAFLSLPRQRAYWSGRPSREDGANPAVLASSLLWLVCPASLVRSIEDPVLDIEKNGWRLQGRLRGVAPALYTLLRISKKGSEIKEIVLADSLGTVVFRAERAGRVRVGRATVPERLRIETGDPRITIEARLIRAREDRTQPPDLFRIPASTAARRLEDQELMDLLYQRGERP